MRIRLQPSPLAALGVALLLGGCQTREQEMVHDTAMQAGLESLAVNNPATGGLTDANILATLDHANDVDSAAGAIAARKGTSAEVRAFGEMMMRDHHALREQAAEVAQRLGLSGKSGAMEAVSTQRKAALDSLERAEGGEAFDRLYVNREVAAHKAVLETTARARAETKSAEVRQLIEQATPVVQRHLDRALELQQRLAQPRGGS